MRVFCYFNLHRKCWSIKALEGPLKGRVVSHARRVNLLGATFKVSEAGRQRVLREQRKNVHAGVVGQWDGHGDAEAPQGDAIGVTYNPYLYSTFVIKGTGEPIHHAREVHLGKGAAIYG